jgi:hypothetical protein
MLFLMSFLAYSSPSFDDDPYSIRLVPMYACGYRSYFAVCSFVIVNDSVSMEALVSFRLFSLYDRSFNL